LPFFMLRKGHSLGSSHHTSHGDAGFRLYSYGRPRFTGGSRPYTDGNLPRRLRPIFRHL